ncbi:MAG: NAD-dependent epimerase/dehydratase family protein, partial [Opitutales bacterium]
MQKDAKIYVAGHRGMVGSAVLRALKAEGYENIVTRTRKGLDLTNQAAVRDFYASEKPDVAVIAAARVGGIHANNTYPAEFMFENLAIA